MANARGWLKQRPSQAAPDVDRETVARVAYQLYEQRGRAHGQALEDWLQAEAIVRARNGRTARTARA